MTRRLLPKTFAELLAPMNLETFLEKHWETEVCFIRGSDPQRFATWIDEEAIRDFIAYGSPNLLEYDVNVVQNGATARGGAAEGLSLLDIGDRVTARRAARVYEAYARGYTLVLRLLHRRIAAVETIGRLFESTFDSPVYPALYLTPPGAQGFAPHWDEDDVYVFQLRGEKEWTVYGNAAPLCRTSGEPSARALERLPIVLEATLRPGDLLYLPRGFVHEARTKDGPSAHLTISVMHPRALDWLRTAMDATAAAVPALTKSLPLGRWDSPSTASEVRARAGTLLEQAIEHLDFKGAAASLHASILERLLPAHGDDALSSIDRYRTTEARGNARLSPYAALAWAPDRGTWSMPGGPLPIPATREVPVQEVLGGKAVPVEALRSDEASVFMRDALARGVVRIDAPSTSSAGQSTKTQHDLQTRSELPLSLSVLDFGHPASTYALAPFVDALGYARYWLGEHHTARQCASPLSLAGIVAGLTRRLRVGTAGVCLPLHGALRVAQQARLLELSFAARIDLGLCKGIAPPPDLARAFGVLDPGRDFEEQLRRLVEIMNAEPGEGDEPSGVGVRVGPPSGRGPAADGAALARYALATGRSAELWVHGVSPESAEQAGRVGAHYCFSEHHNGGRFQASEILERYRHSFRPGPRASAPRTAIVLGGICAESAVEARRLFEPLRDRFAAPAFVDGPRGCADRILVERARSGADEVVVLDAFFARNDLTRAENRTLRRTMFEALAEALRSASALGGSSPEAPTTNGIGLASRYPNSNPAT